MTERLSSSIPKVRRRDWSMTPLDVVTAWPADRPLVMLHCGRRHRRWARWTILAEPREHFRPTSLAELDARLGAPIAPPSPLPFHGGWIGLLAYDLGRIIEPAAAGTAPRDDRRWAPIELAWCPDAFVFDHEQGAWWTVGEPRVSVLEEGETSCHGQASLAHALHRDVPADVTSSLSRSAYLDMVQRGLDYIAAGDVFQVNLTQRITTPWSGSTRPLAARALTVAGAWYGAMLEIPDGRAVVSLSPELFLEVDPLTRGVVTRPIKGTRPARVSPQELATSAKDTAELNMIIDLLRNDLGRVCTYGSVRVPHGRAIESHPTVHHGVGEVRGTLRDDVTIGDLLAATFPGGSVTGAPKIRAMQIIDELEPVRRGPYCGAIGMFSRCGRVTLNIAIRTLALTGERPPNRWDTLDGVLDYGAGGGIVADSVPEMEWQESLDKTEVLWGALGASDAPPTPPSAAPTAPAAARPGTGRSGPPRSPGDPG